MSWTQVCFSYDGSFAGFLSCVFDSYAHRELPACFSTPDDPRISLWPERSVETHQAHARRVYRSLAEKIAPAARTLVCHGFLTCLPERELHLWRFLHLGYRQGPAVMDNLTDDRVSILNKAVFHLEHEAHMYKGFVRFSQQDGVLVAEIEPKNRVLPLLQPHFCTRFSTERFLIYDRTHREALFHQPGRRAIVPLEALHVGPPDRQELDYRALWRRFYDTIAIEGRINPALRRNNMPKRYWSLLTELQPDPSGPALPPTGGEA